jgi:hypothetical protein
VGKDQVMKLQYSNRYFLYPTNPNQNPNLQGPRSVGESVSDFGPEFFFGGGVDFLGDFMGSL